MKYKRKRKDSEIEKLEEACRNLNTTLDTFQELPISKLTKKGLLDAKFETMTEIQRAAIPVSLQGKDVLGAAKTGSGKTLAFLVPVIERLYRQRWGPQDGLGALILSPTRELAQQIFDVLRTIGCKHEFSAGILIGGNPSQIRDEKKLVMRINILITTPGRLLQHMDETPMFDCSNLQILVLDEADRIMDMGFEKAVNSIIDFIPKSRQTVLFSATQTKSVRDLTRLSMKSPEFISVHENAAEATPEQLTQTYTVCEVHQKLDMLWTLIRANVKNKVIVFLSTCKQVRYFYEVFCKLQPGVALLHLHGKQGALARKYVAQNFTKSNAAVLICTDVAARGLDFPMVHLVIQLDAPSDLDTYIHRVGRTARNDKPGEAILCLLPNEKIIENLQLKKVVLKKIHKKLLPSITPKVASICSSNQEIKYLAQKAFATYLKSLYKLGIKVNEMPLEKYSEAMGLPSTPILSFAKVKLNKSIKFDSDSELFEVTECREVPNVEPMKMTHKQILKEKRKQKKKLVSTKIIFDEEGQHEVLPMVGEDTLPIDMELAAQEHYLDQKQKLLN